LGKGRANTFKHIEPWQMDMLITMPTLFMAVGALFWVPLTIGMGRRPVFLIASFVTMLATLVAGYTRDFQQLLACVCFMGLGEGFALIAVSVPPT